MSVLRQQQWHLAHDAVARGRQADKAAARGGIAQARKRLNRVAEIRHPGIGSRAGNRHPRLGLHGCSLAVIVQEIGKHGRRSAKDSGQRCIIVGQFFQRREHVPLAGIARDPLGETGGRGSVGFGKHDIERDRLRPGIGQTPGQVGNIGARPGPLAEAAERFLVDIDDSDGRVLIGTRRRALIAVEQ